MDPWIWAVCLIVLGLGLAVLEVFFPSAGVLGFLAACSILGGILLGYLHGAATGTILLLISIAGLPGTLVLALKYWPHTAVGRRVLLTAPTREEVMPVDPELQRLRAMIGQVGQAKCDMLPAGAIMLDGRTIDAVSEGMPVDAGQRVRIVEVRGNRVVVRPVDDEVPTPEVASPLERPIDDPFS
ncbi:MAG: NfeD family protein [Thermoguttaceae bacterium]|jgi:membrane-bound serine protease (ClpP class)|nr:NfeD family protein [Thermoguttaceae bacterium]